MSEACLELTVPPALKPQYFVLRRSDHGFPKPSTLYHDTDGTIGLILSPSTLSPRYLRPVDPSVSQPPQQQVPLAAMWPSLLVSHAAGAQQARTTVHKYLQWGPSVDTVDDINPALPIIRKNRPDSQILGSSLVMLRIFVKSSTDLL